MLGTLICVQIAEKSSFPGADNAYFLNAFGF